ncbi:putative E3 ubiquitin-protein ligase, partial [Sesbania bispinosa]
MTPELCCLQWFPYNFFQMEWQILLVMGILIVISSKCPTYFIVISVFPFVKAFITLKKGTQLVKYNRKGKPKLCTFRLSP